MYQFTVIFNPLKPAGRFCPFILYKIVRVVRFSVEFREKLQVLLITCYMRSSVFVSALFYLSLYQSDSSLLDSFGVGQRLSTLNLITRACISLFIMILDIERFQNELPQ